MLMDTLTVEKLMQVLQEPNRPLLTLVLRTLGQDRTRAVLIATLHCEAQGGMLTKDGSRRRTPGGIFFQLVKERTTPQERQRLFLRPIAQKKHAQPQAPTWDEVQAIVTTLPQGEATVTLTLIGRPEAQAVQTRPTYVAFRMQGKEPSSLPKGLPPVPGQAPITWLVVIDLRQWKRVQESLAAHADDKLMITGHPVVTNDGAHVLLAQSCVSMMQQREKKAAQHQRQAGTTA
jgi:Phosphorylated adapter RNA export protein, RNA-binding domain